MLVDEPVLPGTVSFLDSVLNRHLRPFFITIYYLLTNLWELIHYNETNKSHNPLGRHSCGEHHGHQREIRRRLWGKSPRVAQSPFVRPGKQAALRRLRKRSTGFHADGPRLRLPRTLHLYYSVAPELVWLRQLQPHEFGYLVHGGVQRYRFPAGRFLLRGYLVSLHAAFYSTSRDNRQQQKQQTDRAAGSE